MDDLIYLIALSYSQDEIGQVVAAEQRTPVWASIQSASRAEWMQAGQQGLNPSLMVSTPIVNYSGEEQVEVGGKRYAIYRTYFNRGSDMVELYLTDKAGVADEPKNSICGWAE